MDRRSANAALVGLGLAAVSIAARGQSPPAMRRVGILGIANLQSSKPWLDAFAAEMAALGWVKGRTLSITFIGANGDADRLPALAAEMVARNPDVIVATAA